MGGFPARRLRLDDQHPISNALRRQSQFHELLWQTRCPLSQLSIMPRMRQPFDSTWLLFCRGNLVGVPVCHCLRPLPDFVIRVSVVHPFPGSDLFARSSGALGQVVKVKYSADRVYVHDRKAIDFLAPPLPVSNSGRNWWWIAKRFLLQAKIHLMDTVPGLAPARGLLVQRFPCHGMS